MSKKQVILTICSILILGSGIGAQAGNPDKSIKGTWSLFVQGSATAVSPLAPGGTPLVAIATVTFDGKGNCSSIDQIIIGGQYVPSRDGFRSSEPDGACDYQVNENGTGFFNLSFPGAGPTTVTFVVGGHDEISFIANNESLGIFGGGTMKKMK